MTEEDKWRMDACKYHAALVAVKHLCINGGDLRKEAQIDAINIFITGFLENEEINFPLGKTD